MHHCTALDNFAVRVLHGVNLYTLCSRSEEVAYIDAIFKVLVNLCFEYLRGCNGAHIADSVHISQGNIATAHKVDKVACSLDILGILRDYPTVKPYIATLIRNIVVERNTHIFSLLDSPHGIATPSEVDIRLLLSHHFLAEVCLPTCNKLFCLFEERLYLCYRFVRCIVHHLVHSNLATINCIALKVDEYWSIYIAESVLNEYLLVELLIVENRPRGCLLGCDILCVVEQTCCTPHIADSVVVCILARTVNLVKAVDDIR